MAFNSNGFNNFNGSNNFGSNGFESDIIDLDAQISEEPKEFSFVLLKPGEYSFEVKNTRVETHQGSGVMNGYPKLVIDLEVRGTDHDGNPATTTVTDNLFLSKKAQWKIANFLACVGAKKQGEVVTPKKVLESIGRTGTVKIDNQEALNGKTNDNGEILKYNTIANYIVPSEYYGRK